MRRLADVRDVVRTLQVQQRDLRVDRALVVAVTGIDGAGKGYVARMIEHALGRAGFRTALINIDGWLNLPSIRFSSVNPGCHFYEHAIRFEELFRDLVGPLRTRRSIRLEMDHAEETASKYRRHTYDFTNVDVVLLEGIFLLKREFQETYDLSMWIDCSFKTALERAVTRAQEGLSTEATIKAYRTIYFPAQETHATRDSPRDAADFVVANDPRLASPRNRWAK